MEKDEGNASRRKFLKLGIGAGAVSIAGMAAARLGAEEPAAGAAKNSGDMIQVLTTDGKLVEVDKSQIRPVHKKEFIDRIKSREGIPGRKFVMVIDLARCKNARKCIDACQEGHMLPKDHEWFKIYLLKDSANASPYWFPKPCYHCDAPLCVSVCPVGATYKRSDGIVLIDTDRCIGCKFCITGCPYSARVFNWKDPGVELPEGEEYSPERAIPPREGTVGKCVFCPDKLREGKLPRCAAACPMGVIYFGDLLEDSVTNGTETYRFSDLMRDRGGFRYLEHLGTEPSVYYLPTNQRQFPWERGYESLPDSIKERYDHIDDVKKTFHSDTNK
jgi:molybdopterin-containing oxidoreductase family iron-sulfur binding subunit